MPFPEIVQEYTSWIEEFADSTDARLHRALAQTTGQCGAEASTTHACASEETGRQVQVQSAPPCPRTYLPKQLIFLHLF